MQLLTIILLWCFNGAAPGVDGTEVRGSEPSWPVLRDCNMPPNMEGKYCGIRFYERRYYFNKTENKCVLFVPTKCGNQYNQGNNFRKRKGCIRKCIDESPCLKKTWRNDTGPLDGFAYYPPLDICIGISYKPSAKLWPQNNIFSNADECQKNCAPADPI
uniref:Putative tick kunitz 13 n=1 Tax=Amblyomma americanum TaxID=6943 RepID=A0A0C9RXA4_AMBAM